MSLPKVRHSYRQYDNFDIKEFEDTKGAIRIRISKKNRQRNGQKKKYKRTNNDQQNIHIKLKIEYIKGEIRSHTLNDRKCHCQKSTKHYTEIERLSNTNSSKNQG
jgi:hypothetical protein